MELFVQSGRGRYRVSNCEFPFRSQNMQLEGVFVIQVANKETYRNHNFGPHELNRGEPCSGRKTDILKHAQV